MTANTRPPARRPYADVTAPAVAEAEPLAFLEATLPADLKPVGAESPAPAPAEQPAPAYPTRAVTLHLTYHGVPVDLYRADLAVETIEKLVDQITRREGWAAAGGEGSGWHTLPDGTPICPKHNTPMRQRNKQNDTWWSHRVYGPEGEELWCKGYHGKDSPGYEC